MAIGHRSLTDFYPPWKLLCFNTVWSKSEHVLKENSLTGVLFLLSLDFGSKVCAFIKKKKKKHKMWILPRRFAREVLLEQVIATDKPIVHCDLFLPCGKV